MRSAPRRRSATALALVLLLTAGACTRSGGDHPALRAPATPSGRHLAPGVVYEEFTSDGPAGPVRVAALRIAPDAKVRLAGVHGRQLATTQTVRDLARQTGALAAVNGSYFDIRGGKGFSGYEGDPTGLYAEGDQVLSEARNDSAALVLGYRDGRLDARITEVSTPGRITADDGATRTLDGVNRLAGRLRPCGGVDGHRLFSAGRHVMNDPRTGLCAVPDEIVAFTPQWGVDTPSGARGSVEAVLSEDGTVRRLRSPAGGPVPRRARVLYGIGEGADWLREHARAGTRPAAAMPMNGPDGQGLSGPVDSVIGGGTRLLTDGRTSIPGRATVTADRAPRTLAGVTKDGSVLLVTLDGREPGVSEGATLPEAADLLRSLGATDGVNLDGGGSTTMVVDDRLRNRPRESRGDPVEERRISTAIAVLPH
ncbi:phosphodiester glycosidase family protein [Streptomyces sp. NPDC059875]|uniref:phosphodiester glycosidase family protein n=1 Tax=unclassified Streptomyces TaxID=2593676 RepID=UPI0036538EBA